MSSSSKSARPRKPYPDFPLFPHGNGQWAKKIRGKLVYFGLWSDPDAAVKLWLEQRDDLKAGRTPRVQKDGLTIHDLCNQFLHSKRLIMDAGELAPRSWLDYQVTCKRMSEFFGKTRLVIDLAATDFDRLKADLAKTRKPITVGNEVIRVRVVFNWAFEQGLIDKPIRFGPAFKKPPKRIRRLDRASRPPRMFEADEMRRLLDIAATPMRAMILLGINAGLGNTDLANLQLNHLDLETGWMNYPRPKTGIARRCPLWPETIAALRDAIAARPTPNNDEDAGCVFLTIRGERCVRVQGHAMPATSHDRTPRDPAAAAASKASAKIDAITRDFPKLLEALKLKRPGLNFYALRHTFQTIAGDARDEVAVKLAMGHQDPSISDDYREGIDDKRLKQVVDTVRAWLWPKAKQKTKRNPGPVAQSGGGGLRTGEEQTSVPPADATVLPFRQTAV